MSIAEAVAKGLARYIPNDIGQDLELQEQIENVKDIAGAGVFAKTEELYGQLRSQGVSEIDACHLCALTHVDGFAAVANDASRPTQASIDMLVRNAVEQTGMNRAVVLRLVSSVAGAFGATVVTSPQDMLEATGESAAFVIPESIYHTEIARIKEAVDRAHERRERARAAEEQNRRIREEWENSEDLGENAPPKPPLMPVPDSCIEPSAVAGLQPLVAAGIPKAKYLMGAILMLGLVKGGDTYEGYELLQDAAAAGDADASCLLADYHYANGPDEWQEAYRYYTGYGALALTDEERGNVVNILNHGTYNRRLLLSALALLGAMALVLVIAPGAAPYAAYRVIGAIALVLSASVLGAGFWLHRTNPYVNLYYVPAVMLVPWVLYITVRLVF